MKTIMKMSSFKMFYKMFLDNSNMQLSILSVAKYYRFFLLAFALGLNSRHRLIHLSKSSSMSIPSGLT